MNKRMIVLVSMVILAATARLLPHLPNVTPIAAMALFGGAWLANRCLAYLLPLALVSTLPLAYVPRSLAARDTRGFVKLVANARTRKIVGAHIRRPKRGR